MFQVKLKPVFATGIKPSRARTVTKEDIGENIEHGSNTKCEKLNMFKMRAHFPQICFTSPFLVSIIEIKSDHNHISSIMTTTTLVGFY